LTNNRFANGRSLQIALLLGEQRFLGQNLFQLQVWTASGVILMTIYRFCRAEITCLFPLKSKYT